ncbi:MAG: fatty acid desaturase family protein [Saprospiraceae bacterium]|nr:fatty acid desaturase family protein [Saprospiraceae bacterium]
MAHHHAPDLKVNVDPKLLKPLFKTQAHRHLFALVFDWVLMLATIVLCIRFFNPIVYILAVIVIGARMHAMAILMHDATHFRFLKNRKWNDLITNLVTMYPLFTSIEVYRENHLKHHKHLNTDHDPDWVSKLGKKEFTFPKSKMEFLSTIFSYFTLFQGLKDAIWFFKRFQAPANSGARAFKITPKGVFYVILFAGLTLAGGWKYFAIFWVVPYLSTFFMFQYIRSVAEHFGELTYDDLLTSTRTVMPHTLERFLLAPHQVGYHLEHHLYPGVPFYNLPKLHKLLMAEADYKEKAHVTYGYISGLMNELGGQEVYAMESDQP